MDAGVDGGSTALVRVLVVEDDEALGRLVARALAHYRCDVTVVRSGSAAVEALHSSRFAAIASDISLPDMSGIEVIARARAIAPAVGIVAITGFVDVDVAVQSMKAGADDFLAKPFNADILWHLLTNAMANRQRRIQADQAEVYRQLAYTDALTGCPNRRFIDEFIETAVEESRATGLPLTVVYLDIDNFKLLNDCMGSEYGDEVLRRVAAKLQECVREPARCARFGGDEFLAVFPGAMRGDVELSLKGVRQGVASIEVLNGASVPLPMRLSCGLASYRGTESPRDLIAEAEDQMYLDKSASAMVAASVLDESAVSEPIVKATNLKALRNLVKAIDRRDSYTRFHSDHATRLALALADAVGLGDDQVAAITLGGPIHDLGKIVVPDEVLRKPGPLTIEERRTMEEHPLMGAAIAAAVTDVDTVVNLIRHHHERFDGDGYPGRLRGEEVTFPTRLFTLTDAFSAMTTDRPYRKGLSAEQAVAEILAGRGTQFDPDLATEFVRLIERQRAEDAA